MAQFPTGTPVGLLAGQVGNPASTSQGDGSAATLMTDRNGGILVRQLGGKRYAAAARGNLFSANMHGATGVVLPVGAATAATCVLWNPAGSGHNVELVKVRIGLAGTAGTEVIAGLAWYSSVNVGAGIALPTSVSPATIFSMPLGGAGLNPTATAAYAATIVAPTYFQGLGISFGTVLAAAGPNVTEVDYDGTVVLAPGSLISLCSVGAAQTENLLIDLLWSEWLP
jgi:hypothetical protein